MQYLRSALYIVTIYALMAVYAVAFLPWALASPKGARAAAKSWAGTAIWLARVMVGLRTEIRGPVPQGEVLVAAKHQSLLDIVMIYHALPRAKFIMKRELIWAPIFGQYALRLGCIPVDRGKRAQAVKKMLADVAAGRADPGQLVIYPQGTRVAPGDYKPYKIGSAVLYRELGQDCVPVACNVGLFWPKRGILRRPGTAVVEFLEPIPAGMATEPFMARLEAEIEGVSERLMNEARPALEAAPR